MLNILLAIGFILIATVVINLVEKRSKAKSALVSDEHAENLGIESFGLLGLTSWPTRLAIDQVPCKVLISGKPGNKQGKHRPREAMLLGYDVRRPWFGVFQTYPGQKPFKRIFTDIIRRVL